MKLIGSKFFIVKNEASHFKRIMLETAYFSQLMRCTLGLHALDNI